MQLTELREITNDFERSRKNNNSAIKIRLALFLITVIWNYRITQ